MAVTDWAFPASSTLILGSGFVSGVANVLAQDGSYMTWGGGFAYPQVRLLNFGFSDLPSGATIDGFEVGTYARNIGGGVVYADLIQLTKDGSGLVGTNQGGATASFLVPGSFAWQTFGGATNKFGTTWTDSEVKASTFGVEVRHQNYDFKYNPNFQLDAYRMRVYYTSSASAPTVSGVDPSSGSTTGGTAITITGTDFTGATGVTIGGASATSVSVVNSTTITCVTPAGTAGAKDVVVTTAAGSGTLSNGFTYSPAVQSSRTLLTESGLPLFAEQGGRLMIEGSGSGAGVKRLHRAFVEGF
jgi:hypothetical protein